MAFFVTKYRWSLPLPPKLCDGPGEVGLGDDGPEVGDSESDAVSEAESVWDVLSDDGAWASDGGSGIGSAGSGVSEADCK